MEQVELTGAAGIIALASTVVLALSILSAAALRAWRDWLDVRRLEIEARRGGGRLANRDGETRLSELKERVRRLEAIASGVDF